MVKLKFKKYIYFRIHIRSAILKNLTDKISCFLAKGMDFNTVIGKETKLLKQRLNDCTRGLVKFKAPDKLFGAKG